MKKIKLRRRTNFVMHKELIILCTFIWSKVYFKFIFLGQNIKKKKKNIKKIL
jgi:hypothetical protein